MCVYTSCISECEECVLKEMPDLWMHEIYTDSIRLSQIKTVASSNKYVTCETYLLSIIYQQ